MLPNQDAQRRTATTRYDYDYGQLRSAVTGVLVSVGFTFFGLARSGQKGGIIFQLFWAPYTLYKQNIFKAYILGEDLPRPFPATGLMASMQEAMKDFQAPQPEPVVPEPQIVKEKTDRQLKVEARENFMKKLDKQNPHMSAEARAIHMLRAGHINAPKRTTFRRKK